MQRKNARVDPDGKLPKEFPLTSHPNGQYSKKHAQKPFYFGRIADGWRAALERFNHDWPYILADQVPPPMGTDPTTVEYVARMFLARSLKRLERGQLSGGSFVDMRVAVGIAATSLRQAKKVRHLKPSDFAELREDLSFRWEKQGEGETARWAKREQRIGVAALKRR